MTQGRPPKDYGITLGQVIGDLTVLDPDTVRYTPSTQKWGIRAARCKCICGHEGLYRLQQLASGGTVSCGRHKKGPVTHGMHSHPLRRTYWNMMGRCYNPGTPDFQGYGARGITVFKGWHGSLPAFLSWIEANLGPRPDGCSLDRIDNDGNYEPGNLRWATAAQQAANRRPRRK